MQCENNSLSLTLSISKDYFCLLSEESGGLHNGQYFVVCMSLGHMNNVNIVNVYSKLRNDNVERKYTLNLFIIMEFITIIRI